MRQIAEHAVFTLKPHEFLGRVTDCVCGKRHAVSLQEVVYAENAAEQLPEVIERCLPQAKQICLLADKRTFAVAGQACLDSLQGGGRKVSVAIVPDRAAGASPVCDDLTFQNLQDGLSRLDLLLAVGAGVISDLGKWLAHAAGVPYMAFATAASMNGYASGNIAPTLKGLKSLLDGTAPLAILTDSLVLREAPYKLTTAGLGDVLAKPISNLDWRISHLLFNDYFCPVCTQLIHDLEPGYSENSKLLLDKDPAAFKALFHALVYSGVSMTMAGTSFPASGGEHLISHALDMVAKTPEDHDLHGRQVGVGTIFAAALYERLAALSEPEFNYEPEETNPAYWGALAPVIEQEHSRKRQRAKQAAELLRQPGVWENVRQIILQNQPSPTKIKQCLRDAGAAHCVADLGCTREHFFASVKYCHQLRERYTVIDLARAAGILPGAIEEIIDKYL